MSFATRCPACTTRFRVVADQLKISEGWVRCGQCGEVFDATQDLVAWSDSSHGPLHAEPESAHGSAPDVAVAPIPEVPATPTPFQTPDDREQAGPEDEPPVDVLLSFPGDPVPDSAVQASEWPEAEAERVETTQDWGTQAPPASDGVAPETHATPTRADEDTWAPTVLVAGPTDDDMPLSPASVGFVRQAQRRAWWQRPGVRWALALLSGLLVLALLLQWVLHERDRIAALRPDLRPALERLCAPLGCSVLPLRWIDALSIESTTLARRGNGRYALEVVLRNASVFELAMPALELSVTDVRDQLLVRRVILPTEMPPPADKVPPQGVTTLRLEVAIDAALGDALAGYRTLVFYP